MKKLLILLASSLFLLFGCSGSDDEPNSGSGGSTGKDKIVLEVIKTYSTDFGELEAYYINDEVNATQEESGIELTINSVEYGKILLKDDYYINAYKSIADADDKLTYVKLSMAITGDASKLENHIFYPYQGDIILENGNSIYSYSSIGDLVSLDSTKNIPTGDVYFIMNEDMPIEQFTFKSSAPFKRSNGLSISAPYEIKVKLPHKVK